MEQVAAEHGMRVSQLYWLIQPARSYGPLPRSIWPRRRT